MKQEVPKSCLLRESFPSREGEEKNRFPKRPENKASFFFTRNPRHLIRENLSFPCPASFSLFPRKTRPEKRPERKGGCFLLQWVAWVRPSLEEGGAWVPRERGVENPTLRVFSFSTPGVANP